MKQSIPLALALVAVVTSTSCGVQAGGPSVSADECATIEELTDIKAEMDELDLEITNLRPASVTPETVRELVPPYRAAARTYGRLLNRAESEVVKRREAENLDTDLLESWDMLIESLQLRRDGMSFFAEKFSNPASLAQPGALDEAEDLGRRTEQLNAALQEQLTRTLRARGFPERDDGSFLTNC